MACGGVTVRGFSKVYGRGKKAFLACDGVNFSAAPGCVTALLGPNGAGKSTLLKAIAGIHFATEGEVCVCGKEELEEIRAVTGFVSELPDLDRSFTVKETLFWQTECRCLTGQQGRERMQEAVEIAEIGDVLGKKLASLSKGYLQRVNLAKALCADPEVLILDEFSGGLDPRQIVNIRKALKSLAKSKTVILSTHHIDEALETAELFYIMNKGRIVSKGSAADIVASCGARNLEDAFLALTAP